MGAELIYNGAFVCGVTSRTLDSTIEELEKDKRDLENQILSLMVASPRKKPDSAFDNWEDYVNYRFCELTSEYRRTISKLALLYSAKDCVENKTVTFNLCPKCGAEMYEKEQVYDKKAKKFTDVFIYECPDCGKKTRKPKVVTIPSFTDSE